MEYPIRILCVFSLLDRGGAENMCMNIYRNIDRDKVQFDFVKHLDRKGDFEEEIIDLGGKIYQAPRFNMANYYQYVRWWKNHFDSHPEHKIVHAHFFTISPIYLQVAKRKGRITINHIHGTTAGGGIKDFIARHSNRVADYKFACSDSAGKWGYGNEDYRVIRNALDIKRFVFRQEIRSFIREKLGIEDAFVLGTVANYTSVKNPFVLIQICAKVFEQNPRARLLWVGSGPMEKEIKEEIARQKLGEKIILLGNRDDVPDILQAMDVFLLPSKSEGLPVSVVEAQTAGLVCICSDAVTKEVDITGLCSFIAVEKTDEWVSVILSAENRVRIDTYSTIKKAGYDINETSRELQEFYLKVGETQ